MQKRKRAFSSSELRKMAASLRALADGIEEASKQAGRVEVDGATKPVTAIKLIRRFLRNLRANLIEV